MYKRLTDHLLEHYCMAKASILMGFCDSLDSSYIYLLKGFRLDRTFLGLLEFYWLEVLRFARTILAEGS